MQFFVVHEGKEALTIDYLIFLIYSRLTNRSFSFREIL